MHESKQKFYLMIKTTLEYFQYFSTISFKIWQIWAQWSVQGTVGFAQISVKDAKAIVWIYFLHVLIDLVFHIFPILRPSNAMEAFSFFVMLLYCRMSKMSLWREDEIKQHVLLLLMIRLLVNVLIKNGPTRSFHFRAILIQRMRKLDVRDLRISTTKDLLG